MTQRITVIGAGVIGLTCAHELAEAGHEVTVVADRGPGDTVSSLAGGLWFPYRSEKSELADHLLERSLIRFTELAELAEQAEASGEARDEIDFDDDVPPVIMTRGTVRERLDPPDHDWIAPVVNVLGDDSVELVPGGVTATLPMVNTPAYLAWMMDACRVAGVGFRWRTVESLDALVTEAGPTERPDAVVLCTGIRGGELLGGDDQVTPIRGQVILMANGEGENKLTEWITDTDDVEAQVYVLPRGEDVVVGGISEVGSWDDQPNVETAEVILDRAEALVPELKELPILGHGAGLRPGRTAIRLGQLTDDEVPGGLPDGVPVIAAYGHGGAGVTLSWGTAERVAELVGAL